MSTIHVLSSETINKIAAGEVVERPLNVVKELVENAIDAGATAVTIEIRNGGIDLIRVTDNGCGIEADQITKAFRRHATSKIEDDRDLLNLMTLGFRGEALSSIAAVSEVEMITKTHESLIGTRATNEVLHPLGQHAPDAAGAGAASLQTTDIIPLDISEVGAPDGTTVIVRNLFYNVPVRKKFLKSAQTEAGYVTDLVEHLALSHPGISFHYRVNNQEKLHTTGNGNEKELIYRIYGREMSQSVIPIHVTDGDYELEGYLGRPEFSRSSRNYEIFFVNGRILRSDVLSRSLEEGYRTDLMQHRFPFAILHLSLPAVEIDVNVHPSKLEVRFSKAKEIYDFINEAVHKTLHKVELIPRATFGTEQEEARERKSEEATRAASIAAQPHAEPFERAREAKAAFGSLAAAGSPAAADAPTTHSDLVRESDAAAKTYGETSDFIFDDRRSADKKSATTNPFVQEDHAKELLGADADVAGQFEQATFLQEESLPSKPSSQAVSGSVSTDQTPANDDVNDNIDDLAAAAFLAKAAREAGDASQTEEYATSAYGQDLHYHFLSKENVKNWHIVGQVFRTYWIIEFQDKMLMIDQHAAHEKVNFERLMRRLSREQETAAASQMVAPPIIVNLTGREEAAYHQYEDYFRRMGYEIEDFGENSYAIRAVPMELYANEPDALLKEILDEILGEKMSGTPAAILYKIASMSCKAAVKGNMTLSLAEAEALIGELLSLDNPYHCPHGRPTMIVLSQKDLEKKFKRIV